MDPRKSNYTKNNGHFLKTINITGRNRINRFSLFIIFFLITIPIIANDFSPQNLEPFDGTQIELGNTLQIRFDVCLGFDFPASASEWTYEVTITNPSGVEIYNISRAGFDANGPACFPITDIPSYVPDKTGKYTIKVQTFYTQEINSENDVLISEIDVVGTLDLALGGIVSLPPMPELFHGLDISIEVVVRNVGTVTVNGSDYEVRGTLTINDNPLIPISLNHNKSHINPDLAPGEEKVFQTTIGYGIWDLIQTYDTLLYSLYVAHTEDENYSNNILDDNVIIIIPNPIFPNEISMITSLQKNVNNLANNEFLEFILHQDLTEPQLFNIAVFDSTGSQIQFLNLDSFTPGESVDSFTVYSYEFNEDILHDNHGAIAVSFDSLKYSEYFISWGGPITAVDGLWQDSTSVDIGVLPQIGKSISLTGQGTDFDAFTWQISSPTPGLFNESQLVPVNQQESLTKYFRLNQNFPNPFNPSTTISYSLAERATIKLIIYDAIGKKINELVNKTQEAGNYTLQFDANNLSSGIYYYTLETDNFRSTKKLLLMK